MTCPILEHPGRYRKRDILRDLENILAVKCVPMQTARTKIELGVDSFNYDRQGLLNEGGVYFVH